MNVLIVGGAGFLGTNMTLRCLRTENCQVTVVDSLDPMFHSCAEFIVSLSPRVRFVQGDVRDANLMHKLVLDKDVIINCAGQTSHGLSIEYPILDAEINCIGNLSLLESVRCSNPDATVVFTSSTTVSGRNNTRTSRKKRADAPLDIYSANKGVAEKYYGIYHALHNLKTVVLRLPNLYGPYGKGYPEFGFVNYFIDRARRGETIRIFGTGKQQRNLLYVKDAVDAIWKAAARPELFGQVHTVVGPEHLSVRSIAEKIVDLTESGGIEYQEWPRERIQIDVGDVVLSSGILPKIIEWEPRYSFEKGLLETLRMYERETSVEEKR